MLKKVTLILLIIWLVASVLIFSINQMTDYIYIPIILMIVIIVCMILVEWLFSYEKKLRLPILDKLYLLLSNISDFPVNERNFEINRLLNIIDYEYEGVSAMGELLTVDVTREKEFLEDLKNNLPRYLLSENEYTPDQKIILIDLANAFTENNFQDMQRAYGALKHEFRINEQARLPQLTQPLTSILIKICTKIYDDNTLLQSIANFLIISVTLFVLINNVLKMSISRETILLIAAGLTMVGKNERSVNR